jgi:hypothetical protein
MIHLSSSNWFGPLFFSQNWTNFENILKNSNFSMDFDNFFRYFECHSILAEKQQTKLTNYSSLSLSASLDTQDTFQGGTIVEWKKFWQEIPVWRSRQRRRRLGWTEHRTKTCRSVCSFVALIILCTLLQIDLKYVHGLEYIPNLCLKWSISQQ